MGTNYYRVFSEEEKKAIIEELKVKLEKDNDLDEFLSACNVLSHKHYLHIGKASGGWDFTWNFHNNRYYHDRETLIKFLKGGVILSEYNEEMTPEEFMEMALNWKGKNNSEAYGRYQEGMYISDSTNFS